MRAEKGTGGETGLGTRHWKVCPSSQGHQGASERLKQGYEGIGSGFS